VSEGRGVRVLSIEALPVSVGRDAKVHPIAARSAIVHRAVKAPLTGARIVTARRDAKVHSTVARPAIAHRVAKVRSTAALAVTARRVAKVHSTVARPAIAHRVAKARKAAVSAATQAQAKARNDARFPTARRAAKPQAPVPLAVVSAASARHVSRATTTPAAVRAPTMTVVRHPVRPVSATARRRAIAASRHVRASEPTGMDRRHAPRVTTVASARPVALRTRAARRIAANAPLRAR
jgi:hypothetical protein